MVDTVDNLYDLNTKKKISGQVNQKEVYLGDIIIFDNPILNIFDEDRYKVIKVTTEDMDKKGKNIYYVVDAGLPVFQVNEFLDTKNDSENTRKKYSGAMCRFLNYLNDRNLHYWDASNNEVEDYIKFRVYGGNDNLTLMKSPISFKTIMDDITVIKGFYTWLRKRHNRIKMSFLSKERVNTASYLYAEIGSTDYEEIVTKHLNSLSESKEYIKWYTDEQIDALVSNLKSKRDKAIFMCTIDTGMRIDEVLSVLRKDYKVETGNITPSRTKSKEIRTLQLTKGTCELIDDYLLGEREEAEFNSKVKSPYLFINLKKGPMQGKPVGYHNFRKILLSAAQKAGLPPDQIRTHSGRSTKAMEYLHVQSNNPELNLTDSQIASNMGWQSINTIKHYKDHRNESLGLSAQQKIAKSKE